MKKRISAELISIAHRILKLKNHSETVQLQQEAKNLYDQLTILRFYEENFEMVKNEISEEVLAEKLEGKPTEVFNAPIQDKVVETPEEVKVEVAPEVEETIAEPITEEKVVIAELIVEDDEEEEEDDVGHAAHHPDVDLAQPAEGRDVRPGGSGTQEAHAKRCGRGDQEKEEDSQEGPVEVDMLGRRQVAAHPGKAVNEIYNP